ncbi:PDE10A [Symbiodinium natans]|uniref:Phosphodiesterase n=1 Tax=Symbiodinium natans TaxID=878477 RepID=A0A812IAF3_9DINO|nr:PDE10A [Symbiodinium natans]
MHDPVILSDGHTYERRYIEKWLQHKDTSPVSGAKLPQKSFVPNHALRNAIEEYFEQVLSRHREAIQHTTAGLVKRHGKFSCNSAILSTIDSLMQCSILLNVDLSVEMVLTRLMDEAKGLVGAEVASVFLVDRQHKELYSTVNSTGKEIRIPFNSGVAGSVACSGEPLIIIDAYADSRFNTEIDRKTGFQTRNILCVPIRAFKAGIIGVAQLINKTAGGVLSLQGEAARPAQRLTFTQDDQLFFEVFASQAGSAIISSGISEEMPLPPNSQPQEESASSQEPVSAQSSMKRLPTEPLLDPAEELEGKMRLLQPVLAAAMQSWTADTLTLGELTKNRPLYVMSLSIFRHLGLIQTFGLDETKLKRFLIEVENGYPQSNRYHNSAHAASVVHFMYALLVHGGVATKCSQAAHKVQEDMRVPFIQLAGILAALMHDFEHEGVTNDFHNKTLTERSVTYNNRSVNEQHHVAAAFRVLMKPEMNFLDGMGSDQFQNLRSVVVEMVLATDMALNNELLANFIQTAQAFGADGFSPSTAEEASMVLKFALKCADIGHLALDWPGHLRWVQRLEEEFFLQGDREKNLKLDPGFLMDRDKPGVSQTQVGFFEAVVLPLFRAFHQACPRVHPMLEILGMQIGGDFERIRKGSNG